MSKRISVNVDQWKAYERMFKKLKDDYDEYKVNYKETILRNVPESLRDEVKRAVKDKLILLEKEKATEELVKINSPLKEREITGLKMDITNYKRQLAWNMERIKHMKDNKEDFIIEGEKVINRWEVEHIVDKLHAELKMMEEELISYEPIQ